jgi:tRNA(Ile)-lysidine synthase
VLTAAARPEPASFSSYDFSGGVAVAVSGGSDSTALLLLLKSHLDRRYPAAPLLAVTVDHALRPGSAAEAQAVAALCAGRGIAHRTMTWAGPKPATGVSAAARAARYRLLAEAAREGGLGTIATGHTADDQAETVRMRQARSDSADAPGLAGMAPATLYDGAVWIARPLLGTRRAALRAFLAEAHTGWIDDPTNADMRFERPRLRADASDGSAAQALATAAHAAREREALGGRAANLVRGFASRPAPGLIRLDPDFIATDDREAALHALRVLLAVVGGTPFLPPKDRAEALLARLAAGKARATLSRCVADRRREGICLHRERRGLPPPCKAVNGMVWDGRRRIIFGDSDSGFVIAPKGGGAAEADGAVPAGVPQSLSNAALAAEPAFRRETGGMNAPEENAAGLAEPVMAPWRFFLPSFDLALAGAVADLLGARPVPAPPFSGRIGIESWTNA